MNILKRFTPIVLSLPFVFSAGISSIAHADYDDDVTGKNVVSLTVYNKISDRDTVYEKITGNTWEDSYGNVYKKVYRSVGQIHLQRTDLARTDDPVEEEEILFMFRLKSQEVHTRDVDAKNKDDDLHLNWLTITDKESW